MSSVRDFTLVEIYLAHFSAAYNLKVTGKAQQVRKTLFPARIPGLAWGFQQPEGLLHGNRTSTNLVGLD